MIVYVCQFYWREKSTQLWTSPLSTLHKPFFSVWKRCSSYNSFTQQRPMPGHHVQHGYVKYLKTKGVWKRVFSRNIKIATFMACSWHHWPGPLHQHNMGSQGQIQNLHYWLLWEVSAAVSPTENIVLEGAVCKIYIDLFAEMENSIPNYVFIWM